MLALAAVAWMLVRPHAGAPASDKDAAVPPLVTVVVPALGAVTSKVSLTGLISARNDMPIGNEGDAGRIAEVLVEAGDRVRKGQVLARLNPITAQSQLDSAEASLDEVRANAAVAQSEWARAQQGDDIFSKEENERRRTTALTAQAKVKAAEAQVRDARNKLAQTIILAPTDGIVLTRTAEVGQIAVPGSTVLFHLARDGEIEMRGQVAEQDVPRLALGQTATVRLGRRGQELHRHDLADWRDHRCRHAAGHRAYRPAGGSESAAGLLCARRYRGGQYHGGVAAADRGAQR